MNQPAYQFDDILTEEQREPKDISDLSWMARKIISNRRQAEMIADFKKREVNQIQESCDVRVAKLDEDTAVLEAMASHILKSNGFSGGSDKKKYEMPGLGEFRFGSTRESVDSALYDNAVEEYQKKVQADNPDLFRTTVKVAPDKKAIGDALKAGLEVEGFRINPKQEAFGFKE